MEDKSSHFGWLFLIGALLMLLPDKKGETVEIPHPHKRAWWEPWAALAQIVIAVGTVGALRYTYKQTSLLTSQIVGTDAARCYIVLSVDPDAEKSLKVSIGNDGKSATPHVEAHLMAQREAGWPSGDKLGPAIPINPPPAEGMRDKDGASEHSLRIEGFDRDNVINRRETLVVWGFWRYNDGFGGWRTDTICQRAIAGYRGNDTWGDATFIPCDKLDYFVHMWLRLEADAKAHHP